MTFRLWRCLVLPTLMCSKVPAPAAVKGECKKLFKRRKKGTPQNSQLFLVDSKSRVNFSVVRPHQPILLLYIITIIVTVIITIIAIINVIIIKPFCAKNSFHTTTSVGMVVKPPFYTWGPGHQIHHHIHHWGPGHQILHFA